MTQAERACLRCNGTGTFHYSFETTVRECSACCGKKTFTAPDPNSLWDMVTTSRGAVNGKRKLRSAPDKKWNHFHDVQGARAYYIWRLARFHGGKDMTMPMNAEMVVRGDPFKDELEAMSNLVAKAAFGTDMAAAARWGRAFGIV